MTEEVACWACNELVAKTDTVCPHCSMPLSSTQEEVNLDDLLASPQDEVSTDPQMEFDLPDIDAITSGVSEEETSGQEFDLPDIGEFEDGSVAIDQEKLEEDMDYPSFDIPDMPEFDEGPVKEEQEEIVVVDKTIISLRKLPFRKLFILHSSQHLYWIIVFYIISLAGFQLISANATAINFSSVSYTIHPEAFLFGWISFFVMGWFYSYKLRQNRVRPKFGYGIIFIIMQQLLLAGVTLILAYLFNPDLLSGLFTNQVFLETSFIVFTPFNYFTSGITFGFVLFFFGYKYSWRTIFQRTPLYKIDPSLADL